MSVPRCIMYHIIQCPSRPDLVDKIISRWETGLARIECGSRENWIELKETHIVDNWIVDDWIGDFCMINPRHGCIIGF